MKWLNKTIVFVFVVSLIFVPGCLDDEGNLIEFKEEVNRNGLILELGFEGGLDFDSNNPDYIEIVASFTQLDFTSEDFSVVVRVTIDSLANHRTLLCRGLLSNDGYDLFISTSGAMYLRTSQDGANQQSASSAGAIVINTWYTVGISRSDASVIIYKDGADVTSSSGTHINPLTSSRSAKIGVTDNKVSIPLDGQIEYFAVFSVALTEQEHMEWHNYLKGGFQ